MTRCRPFVALALLLATFGSTRAALLEHGTLYRIAEVPIDGVIDLPLPATAAGHVERSVRMRRIDVVAPGAKVWVVDADGRHEFSSEPWRHFVSEAGEPRYALSVAPDGSEARGLLIGDEGVFGIDGHREQGALKLAAAEPARVDARGEPVFFACEGDVDDRSSVSLPGELAGLRMGLRDLRAKAPLGMPRHARVAVDTDYELLQERFGGNATNALNHIDTLFAAMTLLYERDLDVRLLRADTYLRTDINDPYLVTPAQGTLEQLDEFGEYWVAEEAGVGRAFAIQLSGKSPAPNEGAGVAWYFGPVNNLCALTGFESAGCDDGQCTRGHFSINRLLKLPGNMLPWDLQIVAHEIGHNFGVHHTHCTNAATGAVPASSGTIDACYASEGSCHAGPAVCPATQTINGVANVQGTLMSYCHVTPLGCTSSPVFHPRNVQTLAPAADANEAAGCFTSHTGGVFDLVATTSAAEGSGALTFTLTRSVTAGAASVRLVTRTTGTAAASDYTAITRTVSFADGTATATTTVPIANDDIDELDETVVVALAQPWPGYTTGQRTAVGTIVDDDTAVITIDDPGPTLESEPIEFTVTLSNPSDRQVRVLTRTSTTGGTATSNTDFTARGTAPLIFAAGETEKRYVVQTLDDGLYEPGDPETFDVILSSPQNVTLGDAAGLGEIADDEPPTRVSVADAVAVTEGGNAFMRFVITRTGVSQGTMRVAVNTVDLGATAGQDYTPRVVSQLLSGGGTTHTINFDVSVINDHLFELDEQIGLEIGGPMQVEVDDGQASGTLHDNDPVPTVSIADATRSEGDAGHATLDFAVTMPVIAGTAVEVGYTVVAGSAQPGSDFVAASGTASIAPGSTATTVPVSIVGDTDYEDDETFSVLLTGTATSVIGDGSAHGTILDNDPMPDPVFKSDFE